MSDSADVEDDTGEHSTWPAFVDLFSATSLLFITFVAVYVFNSTLSKGKYSTTRQRILRQLIQVSDSGKLFTIDSSDRQFVGIRLRERATFPLRKSSWESLRAEGKEALEKIGTVLNGDSLSSLYREVRVIGHSDQVWYHANWELSASRAAVVARFLVNNVAVDPCKISATGKGPYFPLDTTRDSMELNRRIEIQILPRLEKTGAAAAVECQPYGDGSADRKATPRSVQPTMTIKRTSPSVIIRDTLQAQR